MIFLNYLFERATGKLPSSLVKKGPLVGAIIRKWKKLNCQSPSDWGSMQDLTSWGLNDHNKVEKSAIFKSDTVRKASWAANVMKIGQDF